MRKTGYSPGQSLSKDPWLFFFSFLAGNMLLSFGNFSSAPKLCITLLFLVLPFSIALGVLKPSPKSGPLFSRELLPETPTWVWLGLGLAALFVHFYRLITLSAWPNFDDAFGGYLAIDFSQHPEDGLNHEGIPYYSIYPWGLGVLFRFFRPSLFLLWFYPAFLSVLVIPAGYFAARQFFSKSFSFVFAFFLAFSFWPLYLGRMGHEKVLVLLAECLLFWALGCFVRAPSPGERARAAVFLGLATAAGFYVHISWIAVGFFTLATLVFLGFRKPLGERMSLLTFLGSFAFFMLPFLLAGLFQKVTDEIFFTGTISQVPALGDKVRLFLSYVSAVFWGVPPYSCNGSVWGGYLNPVLGSFFFLGLVEMIREWRRPIYQWLLAGMALFFIPAVLSGSLESHRVVPELPLVLITGALGLFRLLRDVSFSRKLHWTVLLIGLIAGVDFYHLAGPYHWLWDSPANWDGYGKSIERYRAYEALEQEEPGYQPGYIFTDFVPGVCDQSLGVAVNRFNRVPAPHLQTSTPPWAAVLTNINYLPFLKKRFPTGKAQWLSPDLSRPDGGLMLFITPLSLEGEKTILQWRAAANSFRWVPNQEISMVHERFIEARAGFEADPFLESCYWEKLAAFDYEASHYKDVPRVIEDLKTAIQKGYPSAHLYYRLGGFYMMNSQPLLARQAFEQALKAPLDRTGARDCLEQFSN